MNGVATVYLSNYLEMSGTSLTKDFYAVSQRIAMRTGTSNPQWILGDHLSSTTTIANATGGWVGTQLYRAWGEDRLSQGSIPTKYRYTGQYDYQAEIGLYFYGARWYDASLGRWAQPDSIIPEAQQGVQAWDRFAYSNNNAVRYTDPTGHMVDSGCDTEGCTGDPNEEVHIIRVHADQIAARTNSKDWIEGEFAIPPLIERNQEYAEPANVFFYLHYAVKPNGMVATKGVTVVNKSGGEVIPVKLTTDNPEVSTIAGPKSSTLRDPSGKFPVVESNSTEYFPCPYENAVVKVMMLYNVTPRPAALPKYYLWSFTFTVYKY